MTTIEQLAGITAQHNEIIKRVVNGSLDTERVRKALQDIIEGKYPEKIASMPIPTDVVARVEHQLKCYEALGVAISHEVRQRILEQAKSFVPLTATDRPLVTGFFGYAPDAINRIWRHAKLAGYESVQYFDESKPVRFAPGMKPTVTHPRLVHFDPNSYQGLSPKDALARAKKDKVRLAGVENIEMLIVEPEWALSWNGTDSPYPYLSGLQITYNTRWSVPYLDRWDSNRRLELRAHKADIPRDRWSSPVVRECKN